MLNMDIDLNELDYMIDECLQSNKPKLDDELIKEIHPQINVQYNSLNIAVGRQRSGKTHTIIREIIKISNVCPRTHLLVYINKTGGPNDTHTVCAPYYKAAPYNISHTKIFQWRFSL